MTKSDRQALDFIILFVGENRGISPSYRELADAMGFSSLAAASRVVHRLGEQGLITFIKGQSRSIELVKHAEADVLSFLPGDIMDMLNAVAVHKNVSRYDIITESLRDALPRHLPIHRRPAPLPATTSRPATSPELAGSSIR